MNATQSDETAALWQAVEQRNRTFDGKFVFAVTSTGVFCRPGCPSRTPRRENVRFFPTCQDAERAGFRACLRCRPAEPLSQDITDMCSYITAHLDESTSLSTLGEEFGMSPFHLQRKFKAALGITPRQFAEQQRMQLLKQGVRRAPSITHAIYDAGFASSSRVYERSASHLGMTPRAYRDGGTSRTIQYAIQPTTVGLLLVGTTEIGICSIQLGECEDALLAGLRSEYPRATLTRDATRLQPHLETLANWLAGQQIPLDLPLDVRATAFQRRVWEYLQRIPYGQTRSYGEIARDLGHPTATRAVARACATNPVALVIPCHRVVKQDGKLAGYRWGIERKKALLVLETTNPAE